MNIEIQGTTSPSTIPPVKVPESDEVLDDKDVLLTKLIKNRYRKNTFFFIIGLLCAILAGNKTHCLVISYFIIFTETAQIAGVLFGFVWIAYIAHILGVLINYVNIITYLDAVV